MALLPLLLDDLEDCFRPSTLLDQHFGLGLDPEDFIAPVSLPRCTSVLCRRKPSYFRPWRSRASKTDGGSIVSRKKDKFQVDLDVQHFDPKEVTVKVSGNNTIIVEGKHEEKKDEHGYISRHFIRKYVVPKGHDVEKIKSLLSSDGVLTITVPSEKVKEDECREIPITQTGQPALTSENKVNGVEEKMDMDIAK